MVDAAATQERLLAVDEKADPRPPVDGPDAKADLLGVDDLRAHEAFPAHEHGAAAVELRRVLAPGKAVRQVELEVERSRPERTLVRGNDAQVIGHVDAQERPVELWRVNADADAGGAYGQRVDEDAPRLERGVSRTLDQPDGAVDAGTRIPARVGLVLVGALDHEPRR